MTKRGAWIRQYKRKLLAAVLVIALLIGLLLYKLGSLAGGLSHSEVQTLAIPVGWHGIYNQPLYLPLKLIQSVIFVLLPQHGQALSRLPNVLFGAAAILSFVWLVRLWHSWRIAIMAGLLFATGAWTLHVSRLAGYDVLYLWAVPTLFLSSALFYRYTNRTWVWYSAVVANGLLLYVPGMFWPILINLIFVRKQIIERLRHFSLGHNIASVVLGLLFLPLLAKDLLRSGQLRLWLGLPAHFASIKLILRHITAVPFHLFVRGPLYPDLWLGRAPVLDVFTLIACLIGIYFYVTHLNATRTRLLIAVSLTAWLLVGLAGPVSLSLLVPLLYLVAATGIAYLLHEWLAVFPLNPLARSIGLALVSIVIALACIYNLRAYFVAWPHNPTTRATFHYHR